MKEITLKLGGGVVVHTVNGKSEVIEYSFGVDEGAERGDVSTTRCPVCKTPVELSGRFYATHSDQSGAWCYGSQVKAY